MGQTDGSQLFSLLSNMGYRYSKRNEEAHLTMGSGGHRWSAVLRMRDEAILIYSQFPYEVCGEGRVLQYCNDANASLIEGVLLLDKSRNAALVRTAALRTDDFYLREQLQRAMERNAAIMLKHWTGLYKAAAFNAKTMGLPGNS